ncbi:MAG TPA: aldehyde dehydrogenase family protein, partial [Bacillota bacterium]|nr:aldehyde dehydrogenase family protein [Bacillota bacterium]
MLKAVNPATGNVVREYAETSSGELVSLLAAAQQAFQEWRRASFAERAGPMRAAARLLRERKDELARLMAIE